jgi:hypothetical protein
MKAAVPSEAAPTGIATVDGVPPGAGAGDGVGDGDGDGDGVGDAGVDDE